MHYPSKQQYNNNDRDASAAWGESEGVYTQLAATPTAPVKSGHDHATPSKHATSLPFAVAVESSIYDQAPPPLAPNGTAGTAGTHGGANTVPSSPPMTTPTTCREKTLLWLRRLPLLLLFHACNGALGIAAFTLVVTLLPLSVGLLPLCCIGIVMFRVLTWTTEWLAKMDVALANLVLGAHDAKLCVHACMGPARPGTFTSSSSGINTKRVLRSLVFLSPRNLGAMVYFATLKFAIGILSIIVAACAIGLPVCMIAFAWDSDSEVEMFGFTYDDHPTAYVLSSIGATLVGLLLLPAVAALSRQLTKLVCAETAGTREPVTVGPSKFV